MALEDVYQRNLHHRTHRAGWLRAASLMIGVAAAKTGHHGFLVTAGAAGIAAGAMSMAVGEYVSVRSQNDIEESDRLLEIEHLAIDPDGELEELIEIYIQRGLSRELATEVAKTMHAKDPLEAHLRDELGQHPHTKARPVQAAIASACAFTAGGLFPFLIDCGEHHRLHHSWIGPYRRSERKDLGFKDCRSNVARDYRWVPWYGYYRWNRPALACEWHLKHPLARLSPLIY